MKLVKSIFKVIMVVIIPTSIILTACKKDSSSSSSTSTSNTNNASNLSVNGAAADNAYDDAFKVALQTGNDKSLTNLQSLKAGGKTTLSEGAATNGVNGIHYFCATETLY